MTETYHIYGFGVDLSQLGNVSLDRLEQLIGMAPVLESKILKWFKEENINKPKLEDYYEFDEENLGLPTLLKEVIFELEGVDLTACEDLNNRTYLLYESRYPWNSFLYTDYYHLHHVQDTKQWKLNFSFPYH